MNGRVWFYLLLCGIARKPHQSRENDGFMDRDNCWPVMVSRNQWENARVAQEVILGGLCKPGYYTIPDPAMPSPERRTWPNRGPFGRIGAPFAVELRGNVAHYRCASQAAAKQQPAISVSEM